MEGNSHDLRPTAARTQSQVAHVNHLYKSVQQLLEATSIIDFSSPVVEVKQAIHVLKSVTTTYSAASRVLTRHYAETMQRFFMNQERVRRRDCVSDVDEALLELNQRLVEVGQQQQSLLNFSETGLSAIDLSAFSAAEPTVTKAQPVHPRASTPVPHGELPQNTTDYPRLLSQAASQPPLVAPRQPAPAVSMAPTVDRHNLAQPPDEGPEPAATTHWWEEPGHSSRPPLPSALSVRPKAPRLLTVERMGAYNQVTSVSQASLDMHPAAYNQVTSVSQACLDMHPAAYNQVTSVSQPSLEMHPAAYNQVTSVSQPRLDTQPVAYSSLTTVLSVTTASSVMTMASYAHPVRQPSCVSTYTLSQPVVQPPVAVYELPVCAAALSSNMYSPHTSSQAYGIRTCLPVFTQPEPVTVTYTSASQSNNAVHTQPVPATRSSVYNHQVHPNEPYSDRIPTAFAALARPYPPASTSVIIPPTSVATLDPYMKAVSDHVIQQEINAQGSEPFAGDAVSFWAWLGRMQENIENFKMKPRAIMRMLSTNTIGSPHALVVSRLSSSGIIDDSTIESIWIELIDSS